MVLHYLLRLEPFTSAALELQGGKFDLPDRLFTDIPTAWQLCNTQLADVKEVNLISLTFDNNPDDKTIE